MLQQHLHLHQYRDAGIRLATGGLSLQQNRHRNRLLFNVRLVDKDNATINVSLDGKPYLPDWQGNPESWTLLDGGWGVSNSFWET